MQNGHTNHLDILYYRHFILLWVLRFCALLIVYKPQFMQELDLLIALAGIPLYYIAVATRKKN